MSSPVAAVERIGDSTRRRCPACGQPLTRLADGRCSLCGYQVDERPITSEDSTPFAKPAEGTSASGWAMCKWVFGISGERLSHLGLMRPSEASHRFARGSLVWFAIAISFWQFQQTGWKLPRPHLVTESTAMTPNGDGWYQLAENDPTVAAIQRRPAALWWNPAASAIVVSTCLCLGFLLGWLWFLIVKRGAERSLPANQQHQGRLGSALHYGTAWVRPASWILMLMLFKPLADVAWVKAWAGPGLSSAFVVTIWSLVAVWLILWWIWLIRLSLTVPVQSRTACMFWLMGGAPLMAALVVAAPLWALQIGAGYLLPLLELGW